MMANCTECDGSGYYGSWGSEIHCLACPTGRAKFLADYERHHFMLTLREYAALETARAEASGSGLSVDTVPHND